MTPLTPTAQHRLVRATREALALCALRLDLRPVAETAELPLEVTEPMEDVNELCRIR